MYLEIYIARYVVEAVFGRRKTAFAYVMLAVDLVKSVRVLIVPVDHVCSHAESVEPVALLWI